MKLLLALALIGIITRYEGPVGAPLKCDTWDTEYHYTEYRNWIAMADPRFECGELVLVEIDGYPPMLLTVLDSGGFAGNCVEQTDGTCPPIIGDLPTHGSPFAPDLSARASVSKVEQVPY